MSWLSYHKNMQDIYVGKKNMIGYIQSFLKFTSIDIEKGECCTTKSNGYVNIISIPELAFRENNEKTNENSSSMEKKQS